MADPERFLRFEHQRRDGLYCYVIRADEADLPGPAWPGLWEQDYPEDPDLSPWRRHAINNSDSEALAVWRALAWALTAGRSRFAIPACYRDQGFRHLTDLDLAVAGDASSELTLFALRDQSRAGLLAAALNQTDRPHLADILRPGDIAVDSAVVRARGTGADQLPHRQGTRSHQRNRPAGRPLQSSVSPLPRPGQPDPDPRRVPCRDRNLLTPPHTSGTS